MVSDRAGAASKKERLELTPLNCQRVSAQHQRLS